LSALATPTQTPWFIFPQGISVMGKIEVVSTKISSCRWQEKLFKNHFIFILVRHAKNVNFYFFAKVKK
jgi:hypothetical protein